MSLTIYLLGSLGSWVLGSVGTNHISSNKAFLANLSTSGYLLTITLANGSKTQSLGVGIAYPLLSVLYVPSSPFNLLSISRLTRTLKCAILFTKESVFLQDRNLERTIGAECESKDLYWLYYPSRTFFFSIDPFTIYV